ncbi:MAG TPA: hypothetical protein VGP21_01390 [Opitutaceae bacterium]|jgi:hypothetical protein|nr:hypothetical protein [Opitutaceae bacterium]
MHLLHNKAHAWSGDSSNSFEGGACRPDALKKRQFTFGQGFELITKNQPNISLARRDVALHLEIEANLNFFATLCDLGVKK